ncbi:MAG: exonuclease domain-containing protein [Candidatus Njordarchaeia archaeon]
MERGNKDIILVVVDVEASGPKRIWNNEVPYHNLLEVGAVEVLCKKGKVEIGEEFHRFIKPITNHYDEKAITKTSGKKMEFYIEHGVEPEVFVKDFVGFLAKIKEKANRRVLLVSDNPEFDVGWIRFYLEMFNVDAPSIIHHNPVSIKDLARGLTRNFFTNLYRLPDRYKVDLKHTHHALDDARRNAKILIKILRDLLPKT